jgi:YVTN family beta-propeller protein
MSRRTLISATVAVTLAASGVAVGTQFASGAGESSESIFVSITPCRLVDTRPGDINVGPRDTKIGPDETATFTAWGTGDADSPCDIPATATAIATNTVAIAPTARSFMTLYPADVDNPGTANLNYTAGQAPTPNAANVPLSATGTFNVFNAFGEVHVVIDVNGYYQPSSNVGPQGPTGPQGNAGRNGVNGSVGPDARDGVSNRISDEQIAELRWFEDPADPTTIAVESRPKAFASDGTYLFVTTTDGVIVIDPSTNEQVDADPTTPGTQPIALDPGSGPLGIAYGNGRLYTANINFHTVSVIDPTTLQRDGADIVLDPSTLPADLAVGDTQLVVSLNASDQVAVIDLATRAVELVSVGTEPEQVVIVGDEAWVSGYDGDIAIVELDSLSTPADFVSVGTSITGMIGTGDYVWATNGADGSVNKVEVASRQVVDIAPGIGTGIPASPAPRELAYDGRWLYLTEGTADTVMVIDPVTHTVVGSVPVDDPEDIYFDGTSVWVSNPAANTIQRLLPR